MKKLHEKHVNELFHDASSTDFGQAEGTWIPRKKESDPIRRGSCSGEWARVQLKSWAEAIIKENEKEINTMAKDKFANPRMCYLADINQFLRERVL